MQNYPGLRWPQLPTARWRPDFPVPPLPIPSERGVFPFQRPVRMAGTGGGHESSGQPPPGPVIYSVHSAAHIPQEIARGIGVPLQYLGFNHPMLHTNDGVQQSFPPHNPRRPDPRSQNTQTRPTVTSPPVSRVIMPAWQHNKPMPLAGIHPYQWTKADVLTWVRWAVDEFSLTGVDEQRFGMNGKALCLLGKEGFTDRVPFAGDVLYNLLHNLIQGYEHLARNNIPISHHHATPVCYPTPPSTTPSPQITVSSPGATGMTRLPDSGDPVPTQPVVSQKSETDKPEVDNLVTSSCSQTGSTEIVRTASAQLHKLKEQHEKLLPSVLSAPELQVQEDPVATSLSPTMPELTKIEDCPTSVITTASQTITTESSQETVIQRPMVAPVAPNSARCEEDQNKPTSQEPTPIQGHKRDPLSRHPKRRWSVDAVARETANPISQDQRAAKVNRVGPTMEGVLQVQGRMMSPPSLPGEKPQRVGENIFIPCPEIERELAKLRERDARRMKLYDKSINEESLRAQRRYMAYAEPGRIIRPFDQVQFQAHLQGGSAVRPPSHAGPVVGEAAVLQHPHGPPHLTQVHAMSAQQVVTPANTPVSVAQKPVALSSTNGAQQQESTTDHQGKERADAQSTQTQETANVDGLKSQKTPDKASEPSHSQPRDGNMPPAVPPGHTALGPHLIRGDARLPFLHSTIEQLRARPPPFLPYMRFPFPAQILGPDGKPLQEMVARHRLPVPVFPQYTRQERDRGPEQVPTSGERQVYLPPTSVEQPPRLVFPPNSTASDQNLRTLPVPPIYRLTVPAAPPSGSSQDQLPVHDPRGRPQDRPVSSRPEDPPSAPPQEHTPVMTDVRVKVEKPEGPEERYGVTPENRQGHDQVTNQQSFPIIKTEPREEEPSEVTGQDQTQSAEANTATTVEPVVQQAVSVTNKEKPSEETSAAQPRILRQILTRDRKDFCKEFWERVHNSKSPPPTILPKPTNDIKPFQVVTTPAQVMIMPMPHPDPRGPPPPPVKRGRGRPRIYWPGYRKKPPPQNNTPPGAPVRECRLLWEFLLRLLANEEKYKHAIKWLDKPRKVFRIVNANAIAKLWGKQKNRENMTYEKLSRAMRYYYRMDILVKEGSQRLTYRFIKGLEDIHADRANRRRNRSGSTNGTTPPNPPPLTNEPHNRMGVLDEDLNGEAKPQSSNVGNMQHETQRLYGTNVENVSSRDSMQVKPEGGSAGQMPTQGVSSPVSPGYGQALDVKMFRRSHLRPQEVENATAVPKMEKDTLQIKIPYRSEDTPASSEQNVRNFRPSVDPQYIELNRMLHHQAIPSSVASSKGYHRTTDNVPQATVTTAPPIFKKRRFSVDGATPYPTTSLDVSKNTKDTAERETAGSAVTEPYPHPRHHAVSADAHVHVRITEAPSPKRTKVHHIFFPPSEHPPEDRQMDSERDKDDSGEQEEPLDMSVKKT